MTVADLSSEGEAAKPWNWGALRSMLRPGGRVGFVGGRAGVEDRIEDLEVASGGRRIADCRSGGMFGVLVGLDFEAGGQGLPGAGGRVVGERMDGDARRGRVSRDSRCRRGRAAGGFARGRLWGSVGVVARFGGKAPEGQLGAGQGGELGDVLRR